MDTPKNYDTRNWVEGFQYLNQLCHTYNLSPLPSTKEELWDYYQYLRHDDKIYNSFNEIKALIRRTYDKLGKDEPYINRIRDILSRKPTILSKSGFNAIWKGILEKDDAVNKSEKGSKEEKLSLKEETDLIVTDVLSKFDIITVNDSRDILIRQNIAYLPNDVLLTQYIDEKINALSNGSYSQIYHNIMIQIENKTLFDRNDFYTNENIIIFKNGIYDFIEEKFTPKEELGHIYAFYEIKFDYIEGKYECPKFEEALKKWLGYPNSNVMIEDVFEMMGLAMTLNTSLRKSIILYGETGSGKTTFFNILSFFFDIYNMSETSLQRIGGNFFGLDNLQFKVLNYCDDLPETSIESLGLFKQVTGGGRVIQGEKKHGNKFQFTPYAKWWFNANIIPLIKNYRDTAGIKRFIIIPFQKVFDDSQEDYILDFSDSIINDPNEVKGIVCECMEGYKRLLQRKGFRKNLLDNTVHIWAFESDPLYRFITESCIRDVEERIEWNEFIENFNDSMRMNLSSASIRATIEQMGFTKMRGREVNIRHYYITGLKWNKKKLKELGKIEDDDEPIIDMVNDKIRGRYPISMIDDIILGEETEPELDLEEKVDDIEI